MPKDEFDFEDPMELSGVVLATEEETMDAMCDCFIEEFMRLGYDHRQIFSLFKNPHYLGMNMVLRERGEDFIRRRISEVFVLWGKSVAWDAAITILPDIREQPADADPSPSTSTDPFGCPAPAIES